MGALNNPASGVSAGTVAHFAASTAPAGWLKANGAAVSRATYAALFLVIGTTYGAGDGATTFNLPDLRGEFLRGFDDGRGLDVSRVMGSVQMHQTQDHSHIQGEGNNAYVGRYGQSNGGTAQAALAGVAFSGTTTQSDNTSGVQGANAGSETRPRNVALLACIKY